jgi:hypothetical protein
MYGAGLANAYGALMAETAPPLAAGFPPSRACKRRREVNDFPCQPGLVPGNERTKWLRS